MKTGFVINGLIPFGFIFFLMTFYFHAAAILGSFPVYNQPDPKKLDIYYDYIGLITISGNIWVYSLLIFLLMIVLVLISKRRKTDWRLIGLSSIGHIIAILLLFSGIVEWFAD